MTVSYSRKIEDFVDTIPLDNVKKVTSKWVNCGIYGYYKVTLHTKGIFTKNIHFDFKWGRDAEYFVLAIERKISRKPPLTLLEF